MKNTIFLLACLCSVTVLAPAQEIRLAKTAWPMYQVDWRHTGITGTSEEVEDFVIVGDINPAGGAGSVIAFKASDGSVVAKLDMPCGLYWGVTVGPDGRIYFANKTYMEGNSAYPMEVYCVKLNVAESKFDVIWSRDLKLDPDYPCHPDSQGAAITVSHDGTKLTTCIWPMVYVLDAATGATLYGYDFAQAHTNGGVGNLTMTKDDYIYGGSNDGHFYRFAPDLNPLNEIQIDASGNVGLQNGAALNPDETLVYTTTQHYDYGGQGNTPGIDAYHTDGSGKAWTWFQDLYADGNGDFWDVAASVMTAPNGRIFAVTGYWNGSNCLFCVDPVSQTTVWNSDDYYLLGDSNWPPGNAIGPDNKVFVGKVDGGIVAFDGDYNGTGGNPFLWHTPLEYGMWGGACVGGDLGIGAYAVYVPTDGKLYKLNSETGQIIWGVESPNSDATTKFWFETVPALVKISQPAVENYAPTAVQVLKGTYNSGDLNSFVADDDNYYVLGAQYDPTDPLAVINATVQLDTNVASASYASGLFIVIEKTTTTQAKYRIRAVKAAGGFAVLIDNVQTDFSEVTLNPNFPSPVSDFINTADNNRMRVESRAASGNRVAGFFRYSIDFANWQLTP